MKLKIAILLLLSSQLVLAGNYCFSPKLIKPVECNYQDLSYELNITAIALSSEPDRTLFGFDVIQIKEVDLGTAYYNPIGLNLSGQSIDKSSLGYTQLEHVDTDVKFNIVYETFVSVTYEPWQNVWVFDHFQLEHITDKYRNSFTMLTLKINIL